MTVRGSERVLGHGATHPRLVSEGRLASATLVGLRDTGGGRDGDPELELELDLDLDGTRRTVLHRQVVSGLAARELRLGASLPIRVDPDDPRILCLA